MRGKWRTLMCSLQPSLQQGRNSISQRQQIFTNISRFANNSMSITRRGQFAISIPAIGTYFTVWFNTFFNRWYQALPRGIFDLMQADSSGVIVFILNRNHNQGFTSSTPSTFSRTRSSNIGFIDLNGAFQAITARTYHRNPQFVQQRPCRFIPVKSKNSVKAQRTNSMLLANHLPHSSKPQL